MYFSCLAISPYSPNRLRDNKGVNFYLLFLQEKLDFMDKSSITLYMNKNSPVSHMHHIVVGRLPTVGVQK